MKLKVREIAASPEALGELVKTKLKIAPAYWLARQVRLIREAHLVYEQKRTELVQQYGLPDSDGNLSVTPKNAKWNEFNIEWMALMNSDLEVDLEPKPIKFLGDIEVEPSVLLNLQFLFDGSD